MKKLLLINSFYSPTIIGGAEIFVKLLAESLSRTYEIHVLTTGSHTQEVQVETINHVTIHRLPVNNIYWPGDKKKRNNLLKLRWHIKNIYMNNQYQIIKEIIKSINPEIVHTHNLMGIGTYVWNISSKMGIPVVHTTHDYQLLEPVNYKMLNNIFSLINRVRSKNVSVAIGVSKYTIDQHIRSKYFSRVNSVKDIPNVVNCERFSRTQRIEGKPLTIAYIGQIEEIKGIKLLIDLLNELKSNVLKQLIICGSGSKVEEVKNAARMDKRIQYKNQLDSKGVQKIMASVDLVIVPSIWQEPFGRVLIESYNQGTPVIASRVGGIPGIVYDEQWLFNKNDLEDLKNKVLKFFALTNPEIENEIEKSYKRSQSFSDNIPEHLETYCELLKVKNDKKI